MKRKHMFMQVRAVEDTDDGAFELDAVASSGAIDRDGEIIDQRAWEKHLPRFEDNPVILAAHMHRLSDGRSPVIGSAVSIGIDEGKLQMRVRFAGTQLGKEYAQLYRERHMRAFSVGFIVHAEEPRQIEGKRINTITEAELLEVSAVAVPANPEALSRSRAAAFGDDQAEAILAALRDQVAELKGWISDQIDEIRTLALPDDGDPYDDDINAGGGVDPGPADGPASDPAKGERRSALSTAASELLAGI
jgi:HK97 family phage prohead protease